MSKFEYLKLADTVAAAHDLAEQIVHLVLARTPDAPEGTRGISLFLVPKLLPDGSANDLRCVSIEHKLGIHASPTAVMAYGEKDGAIGHLVGEAHRGLEYMFIMMNLARFSVGLEGGGAGGTHRCEDGSGARGLPSGAAESQRTRPARGRPDAVAPDNVPLDEVQKQVIAATLRRKDAAVDGDEGA